MKSKISKLATSLMKMGLEKEARDVSSLLKVAIKPPPEEQGGYGGYAGPTRFYVGRDKFATGYKEYRYFDVPVSGCRQYYDQFQVSNYVKSLEMLNTGIIVDLIDNSLRIYEVPRKESKDDSSKLSTQEVRELVQNAVVSLGQKGESIPYKAPLDEHTVIESSVLFLTCLSRDVEKADDDFKEEAGFQSKVDSGEYEGSGIDEL